MYDSLESEHEQIALAPKEQIVGYLTNYASFSIPPTPPIIE